MVKKNVAQILGELGAGDESVSSELLPLVYEQLRALAARYFIRQPLGHTLQPTALVHEAFIRLMNQKDYKWSGRAHFMAVAAKAMRQILMNHARDRGAAKRGGGWKKVTLDEGIRVGGNREIDFASLDDALTKLSRLSTRQCQVVELRFFGGLTIAETAHVLGVGTTTIEDDWHLAKAWLARELRTEDTAPPRSANGAAAESVNEGPCGESGELGESPSKMDPPGDSAEASG